MRRKLAYLAAVALLLPVVLATLIYTVQPVREVLAQYFPNIILLDGAAGAPSIGFNAAATTGLYRDTVNSALAVTVGGSQLARVQSSGTALGSAGTPMSQIIKYTVNLASPGPAGVPVNTCQAQDFNVTGVSSADLIIMNYPFAQTYVNSPTNFTVTPAAVMARASSLANWVEVLFCNPSGGATFTPNNITNYVFWAIRS